MRAKLFNIQLASFVCALLCARLHASADQKKSNNDVNDDTEERVLRLKKLSAIFVSQHAEGIHNTAPPYKLTQQQIGNFEAIMSAGADIPTESWSTLTNRTLQLHKFEHGDTRNFHCLPLIRFFNVDMRRALLPSERVAVVGDHDRLGAWQVERAIEMTPNERKGAQSSNHSWSAKVPVCANARLYYRYFIFSLDRYGRRRVHEWEGVPYGRVLEKYQMYRRRHKDQFGLLSHMTIGNVEYEKGWLRNEYAIEFKFIWAQHLKFYSRKRFKGATQFLLKMLVARTGFALQPNSWSDTDLEVSRHAYNNSYFQPQTRRGALYTAGDVLIFRFTIPLNMQHAYQLNIFTANGEALGDAEISTHDLYEAEGVLRLPILSAKDGFRIGTLTLPYVIISPLQHAINYNMRGSFQRYWPMNWPPIDIAHRGLGASFGADAPLVENTIASFLYANEHKAEMIQFDVQLTRDYVPVIWHDFGFKTARRARKVRNTDDLEYVLIKDLTYKELKNSRVFAIENEHIYEYTHFNLRAANETERIFPTLRQVFEALPPTLGMAIEIKWPQTLQSNVAEASQMLNTNRAVDIVLKITMRFGCGRPLLFASRAADICTMLRLKQNVFPVAFITMGQEAAHAWPRFKDLRTRSYVNAVNFAQSANLLGTVAHAADFLGKGALLGLGLDLGQANFVWGDDLRNAQTVEQFKRWHVSGVIYDRIDLYGPQRKRENFFNAPELVDIFARQCIVIGHMNCSSVLELPDGNDLHGKPVTKLGCEVIVQHLA